MGGRSQALIGSQELGKLMSYKSLEEIICPDDTTTTTTKAFVTVQL